MKFNSEINKYLNGELFSAGLDIPFSKDKYPDQSRIDKIIELTTNKNVIHVGCADHLPLIMGKIKNKKWLHGLLLEKTAKCIGIDNNSEAVDFINKQLGIKDVYYLDITTDNSGIFENYYWDYLILGEIIEHIDNPIAFLSKIKEKFKGKVDKIIITAPNVFNLLTIKDIKNNVENINTDHRYWFSPYTLSKVVLNSGMKNCELSFSERIKLPFFRAIIRRLKLFLRIKPFYSANCFSDLVIIADL
jgi:hypothetical protein